METFSALLGICTGNFPVQRPVTRSFDVWINAWINDWVNSREAGDLRRRSAHYDVIVIGIHFTGLQWRGSMRILATLGNRLYAKHWNGNAAILMRFSSLAAPEVVKQNSVSVKLPMEWFLRATWWRHNMVALSAWASWQIRKVAGCACAGNEGNVFPATSFKGNR